MLMAPGKGHRPLRLHRWADRVLYYNPDIIYKSGERIAMADYLSRMTTDTRDTAELSTVTVSSIFESDDLPVVLEAELQAATANDSCFRRCSSTCRRAGVHVQPYLPSSRRTMTFATHCRSLMITCSPRTVSWSCLTRSVHVC
jgi:hypothetical protein